ncbi:hypothetical protein KKD19_07130 [Patescibacteria group bacterium]|nr:hypothetical protein [Patescibacteria group bacterium]MCG2693013.1 hypothetical protein [Candidatus Parcubacteria bacterium]
MPATRLNRFFDWLEQESFWACVIDSVGCFVLSVLEFCGVIFLASKLMGSTNRKS